MNSKQKTIASEITFTGTGLHSGKQVTMKFRPAQIDCGIKFIRTDLAGNPEIVVDVTNAARSEEISRRTVLKVDDVSVSTVEHVLAAVVGLGIDNLIIELDGPEVAEPDGSSAPFVEILKQAGLAEQDAPKRYVEVKSPISVSKDGVELVALPHNGLRVSFTIDFPHPLIGTQYASFEVTEDIFEKQLAPARTFSLVSDVEMLKSRGLIKGGSLKNSIVVGDDGILNEEPLRFSDEFVRHKILDLIGDLALLGAPLRGHIIAVKSGHASNIQLVRKLHESFRLGNKGFSGRHVRDVPPMLSIEQIQEIMPHRYPFLLVDRIVELEKGRRVVGIKNVTINEPFFAGHFPGHPIMPAVLIIEAMAQVGGVLLLSMVESPESKLVYFMAIDKAKFRKPVFPGDQIRFELEMMKLMLNSCKMKGYAYVDDKLVAEAELLSVVMDREEVKKRGLNR